MKPINARDLEALARERLPTMVYDYYAGGSEDELTLRENVTAFGRIKLKNRVLRDVAERDLSATVLGQRVSMPIMVAPTAFHAMAHPEGELATARAAGAAGIVMTLCTAANHSIEEVMAVATGPVWFQLYVYKDREATREIVERAEEAGCGAIVLTADAQVWGTRERDTRNSFRLPTGLSIKNVPGDMPESGGSSLATYVSSKFDPSLSWDDLEWLRSITSLPILVKGILHADDAKLALHNGASAVIVSNHGGRQLDSAVASIEALPEVVDAVGSETEVFLDGGIRRGTDVVKALAVGAKAVAVGRPVLWGLAVSGEEGVSQVLELLRVQLDITMALCGATTLDQLDGGLVSQFGLHRQLLEGHDDPGFRTTSLRAKEYTV